MRVWIDLANSPHVPLFEPVVERLRRNSSCEVVLTARDHAQTAELAERAWPDVLIVGGRSPGSRFRKGAAIIGRAEGLRRFALRARPDVALSHGSYAQVVAARAARIPVVTMMDYEFQPANHLSFRLADRILVPELFPQGALARFGASAKRVVRYPGFKEQLYLDGFSPEGAVLRELELDEGKTIAVFRPPPTGALYHRGGNHRFDDLLDRAEEEPDVQAVVLPRNAEQFERYAVRMALRVPRHAVDGRSLLAYADLAIGAGGTMNRESALLGTPTYTVFNGRLAAVDTELIKLGLLIDLRDTNVAPRFQSKSRLQTVTRPAARAAEIEAAVLHAVEVVAR